MSWPSGGLNVERKGSSRIDMKRTLLSWSSGKDSAWSLHLLRQQNEYEIVGLLTTFNQAANRVAMHAVRRSLVEAQAKVSGVPLWDVDLPWPCSNADYDSIMEEVCKAAVRAGIEYIAFGDLFLTDIRAYREKQLSHGRIPTGHPAIPESRADNDRDDLIRCRCKNQ
jgi:hypothetical protein